MNLDFRFAATSFLCASLLGVACDSKDADPDPALCVALDDEPEPAAGTTIEVKNVGAVPLFLGSPGDRHDLVDISIDGVGVMDEPGFPDLRCATIEDNLDTLCEEEPLARAATRAERSRSAPCSR